MKPDYISPWNAGHLGQVSYGPAPRASPLAVNVQQLAEAVFQQGYKQGANYAKLADANNKENAYTTVISPGNGFLYTQSPRGQPVLLAELDLMGVTRVRYAPQYHRADDVLLWFTDQKLTPLLIPLEQFLKPKRLLSELRMHTGRHIYTAKNAATLERLITSELETRTTYLDVFFYGGWYQVGGDSKKFQFYRFPSALTTHNPLSERLQPVTLPAEWEAKAREATTRLLRHLEPLGDRYAGLMILLATTGFLYSLLQLLDRPFQMGIALLTSCPVTEAYLTKLFASYQNNPISLSCSEGFFRESLFRRKDEIAVLTDPAARRAKGNVETLLAAIHGSPVVENTPLQALPVIISSQASQVTTDPDVLAVEVDIRLAEGNDEVYVISFDDFVPFYVAYIAERTATLLDRIEEGMRQARRTCPEELTTAQIEAIGILYGVRTMIGEYFHHIGLGNQFEGLLPKDLIPWLVSLMEDKAYESTDYQDMADGFIRLVREMVSREELNGIRVEDYCAYYHKEPHELLYDDRVIFFPSDCFRLIAERMTATEKALSCALAEQGLLEGAPANRRTRKTRKKFWLENGQHVQIYGYALHREIFDREFDPLAL